jgi:CheY-like chemotaxis protein
MSTFDAQEEKSIRILLVEDNPTDIELSRQALEEVKLVNQLDVVRDGVEAIQFLRRTGRYASALRPDLILLDLNLPKKDGREVLTEIKADPGLKTIPVVVLTTSEEEEDVLRSYELQANCYIAKPLDLEKFLSVVRAIHDFWLSIVRLPPPG